MLRKLVNHAEVQVVLEPAEPLLIASGAPNAAGIDLPFVLTYRHGKDTGEPYLPGSSLKGVLRSHAERISRALAPDARVCDPHCHKPDKERNGSLLFCGDRLRPPKSEWNDQKDPKAKKDTGSHTLYKKSCPICRTFGSTIYRGRLAIGDANLTEGGFKLEKRDGVGIDRFSGGASRNVKFEMEVLTQGNFLARIRLENFEDWQLGLLALLCRDLEDEFISLGHATTRGLGRLRGRIESFTVMYIVPPSTKLSAQRVHGVGSLLGDNERMLYGYFTDDHFNLHTPPKLETRGVRLVQSFRDADTRGAFFDDAVGRWVKRMEAWRAA